jgi:hypothetical protein
MEDRFPGQGGENSWLVEKCIHVNTLAKKKSRQERFSGKIAPKC